MIFWKGYMSLKMPSLSQHGDTFCHQVLCQGVTWPKPQMCRWKNSIGELPKWKGLPDEALKRGHTELLSRAISEVRPTPAWEEISLQTRSALVWRHHSAKETEDLPAEMKINKTLVIIFLSTLGPTSHTILCNYLDVAKKTSEMALVLSAQDAASM